MKKFIQINLLGIVVLCVSVSSIYAQNLELVLSDYDTILCQGDSIRFTYQVLKDDLPQTDIEIQIEKGGNTTSYSSPGDEGVFYLNSVGTYNITQFGADSEFALSDSTIKIETYDLIDLKLDGGGSSCNILPPKIYADLFGTPPFIYKFDKKTGNDTIEIESQETSFRTGALLNNWGQEIFNISIKDAICKAPQYIDTTGFLIQADQLSDTIIGRQDVCEGETITYLTTYNKNYNYKWSLSSGGNFDNDSSSSFTVEWIKDAALKRDISIEISDDSTGCTIKRLLPYTVTVHASPGYFSDFKDSVVCKYEDETIILDPLAEMDDRVIWFGIDDTISYIEATLEGDYVYEVGAGPYYYCRDTATFQVLYKPEVSMYGDTSSCVSYTEEYSADFNQNYSYEWSIAEGAGILTETQNRATINWLKPNFNIIYLTVTNNTNNCSSHHATTTNVYAAPDYNSYYLQKCCIDELTNCVLEPNIYIGDKIYWSEYSDSSTTLEVSSYGVYSFRVAEPPFRCWKEVSYEIESDCKLELYVPEAFTPNNDGINDNLLIFGHFDNVSVKIFSLSGNLIYEITKKDQVWDGTVSGKDLPTGSYYYKATYSVNGGTENVKNGYITLIR